MVNKERYDYKVAHHVWYTNVILKISRYFVTMIKILSMLVFLIVKLT